MKAIESKDYDLLTSARDGDQKAFEKIVRRHQKQVYNLALKLLGSPEDAEDVLQETFLALYHNLKRFRGQSSLATYLYRLATNFSLMKLRRRKSRRQQHQVALEEAAEHPDPQAHSLDRILDSELHNLLNRFLLELNEKERAAVVLADIEGLPAAQAARILGLSLPAFKSRLHRARNNLRLRLLPYLKSGAKNLISSA